MLPQDVRACMWIFECMQVDVVFGAGEREMGLRWRRPKFTRPFVYFMPLIFHSPTPTPKYTKGLGPRLADT